MPDAQRSLLKREARRLALVELARRHPEEYAEILRESEWIVKTTKGPRRQMLAMRRETD